MPYQMQSGKPHNFSHLLTIARRITMGLTFLTHWLGVIGAEKQLDHAVFEQLAAMLAQHQIIIAAQNLMQPGILDEKGFLIFRLMIFTAENGNETTQHPQVFRFLSV